MLLQELKQKTDVVFDRDGTVEFMAGSREQDELDALKACGLGQQHARRLFDLRVKHVQSLGFQLVTIPDMVQVLTGKRHDWEMRHTYRAFEWAFNHHTETIWPPGKFGSFTEDYGVRPARSWWKSLWAEPETEWFCRLGKLDDLKRAIPYGVALRLNELKETRVFNAFHALAPVDAWRVPALIDPIVLGVVWELPPDDKGEYRDVGEIVYFFVAQW